MKIGTCLILSVILTASSAWGQQGQPQTSSQAPARLSAINTLWAFGRARGTHELGRVVGIVGFYGQDQPRQWRLLAHDSYQRGMMREYVIENGRVIAERKFAREPDQDLPSIVLPTDQLKVDSRQAFMLAEAEARNASIGFDSIHYQLRCRDLRSEPVWVLNLCDQAQKTVGVVYVSAINGEVLRRVWSPPGTRQYEEQGKHQDDLGDYLQKGADKLTDAFRSLRAKATGSAKQ